MAKLFAAISRGIHNRKARKANRDADIMLRAKKVGKNYPKLDAGGVPTEAFKAVSASNAVKSRLKARIKKGKKLY